MRALRVRRPFGRRYRSPVRFVPCLHSHGASVHCVRLSRDVVPTADLLFFASPKKSRQKKGDPTVAVRLRRTALRCSGFGASRPTRFVRCAHAAQTNVAKSVVDARYRARPQTPALLDATHGTQEQYWSLLRNIPSTPRFASGARRSRRVIVPMRSEANMVFGSPWVASRSAGVWGRVRSTLRNLTSRRLSERSGRRPRSEFGARPQIPSTAEQSAKGRPPPSGRLSFGSFSLAKQRKGTALSGAYPDIGLTQ